MIYFDLLPDEINQIILFNLPNVNDLLGLSKLDPFKKLIQFNSFWKNKLIYEYPEINLSAISSHLLSYADNPRNISKLILDYILIRKRFNLALEHFDYTTIETSFGYDIPLASVNNFDLLEINDENFVISYNDANLYNTDDERNLVIVRIIDDNLLSMDVLGYNKKIFHKQGFNLLFHAYCNGYIFA